MRTVFALIPLTLTTVVPVVAQAEGTHPTASLASHGGDMAGRLGYVSTAPYSPSVVLELRAAAGHDAALLGPLATCYRTQPELQFGLRPIAHLGLFAGGGVGAAYVVPDPGARAMASGPTFTLSGALGARFPWERVPMSATVRTESVMGFGTAVTLDVALDLAAKR